MIVMSVVNAFGTAFIAGFTSTNKLYGLLEIAALSYGFAINTYVGQNFGAGKTDRIRSGMKSVSLKLYPGCRHEILNELNKDEVYADVATWIGSKL